MQNKTNLEKIRAEFTKVLSKHIESDSKGKAWGSKLVNAPMSEKLK